MSQHDAPTLVLGLDVEATPVPGDESATAAPRRERRGPRNGAVRLVEYTPFPSTRADATPRTGFTRDVSGGGMSVGTDAPERVGALLRVTLCELDGLAGRPGVERVVWCERGADGRWWLGLERVTGGAC